MGSAQFGGGGSGVGFDINVVTLAVILAAVIGYALIYRMGHRDGAAAALRSADVRQARFGGASFGAHRFSVSDERRSVLTSGAEDAASVHERLKKLESARP